jgi:hypothetical protein
VRTYTNRGEIYFSAFSKSRRLGHARADADADGTLSPVLATQLWRFNFMTHADMKLTYRAKGRFCFYGSWQLLTLFPLFTVNCKQCVMHFIRFAHFRPVLTTLFTRVAGIIVPELRAICHARSDVPLPSGTVIPLQQAEELPHRRMIEKINFAKQIGGRLEGRTRSS